jgi:putative PIN family toxin of toxin-antitoxin system
MLRVVFHTVVFVRALINPHGIWGRLIFQHADAYTLVISPPVVAEILEVLHRPELTRRFRSLADVHLVRVIEILEQAEAVDVDEVPPVSRDPKDDKFLATALAGAADYLVSEDQDLLVLGEHHGIPIITASRFLTLLEAGA